MTFVPEGFGESGQGWWRQGLGPVRAEGENRPSRPSSVVVAHTLRAEGMDASEDGTGRGTPLVVAPPLMAGAGTNHNSPGFGRDQAVVVAALTGRGNRQDDQETGQLVFESRFARNGRGAPTTIVPPLKAQSGQSGKGDGAPLLMAQSAVRRLTPRECEALQGFPDGWTEGFSDSTRYRMLGNAICVNVAEWVLTRIAAEEERR